MQKKQVEPRVVRLLRCIETHPELYGEHGRHTARNIKQTIWDQIAKTCGFLKTADAKCRWRGLIVYFRQILEAVAKKKLRRYIPNTGNPEDKFIQLSDWRYYEYIKFMEPYMNASIVPDPKVKKPIESSSIQVNSRVQKQLEQISSSITVTPIPAIAKKDKIAPTSLYTSGYKQQADFQVFPKILTTSASCVPTSSQSITEPDEIPIKLKIGEVVVEIQVDNEAKETLGSVKNQYQPGNTENKANETTISTLPLKIQSKTKYSELSTNDQNLKSFFDAMLMSTQKLPKYHQERIKRKLLSSIKNKKT